jgi:regulator of sigma E protease
MIYLGMLLLLSLLILLHEVGHLLAARAVGIPIAGFSVGLGPKIWKRQWGATEYSLRALPLGGFVVPALEDDEELRAIPLRKRLVFFAGGPLANVLTVVPLFAALNLLKGSGASFESLLIAPFQQTAAACWQFLTALPALFSHPESLSGVVGIVVEGGRLAQTGMVLEIAISLSISLAVLNLLPIPVLDGGQILMGCLEEAFPRTTRARIPLTVMGLVLLAAVMIVSNLRDVVRYWG